MYKSVLTSQTTIIIIIPSCVKVDWRRSDPSSVLHAPFDSISSLLMWNWTSPTGWWDFFFYFIFFKDWRFYHLLVNLFNSNSIHHISTHTVQHKQNFLSHSWRASGVWRVKVIGLDDVTSIACILNILPSCCSNYWCDQSSPLKHATPRSLSPMLLPRQVRCSTVASCCETASVDI